MPPKRIIKYDDDAIVGLRPLAIGSISPDGPVQMGLPQNAMGIQEGIELELYTESEIQPNAQLGQPFSMPAPIGEPFPVARPALRMDLPIGTPRGAGAFAQPSGHAFSPIQRRQTIPAPRPTPKVASMFGGLERALRTASRPPVVRRPASGIVGERLAGRAATGRAAAAPEPSPREQAPASGGAAAAETGFVPTSTPFMSMPSNVPLTVARGLMTPEQYARWQAQQGRGRR